MGNTKSKHSKPVGDVGPYKIKYHGLLGRGSFGEVFHAKNLDTNEEVAAKRIIPPKDFNWKSTVVENTRREIEILKSIQGHENIIKVYDTYDLMEDNEFWIITEYCNVGDLNEYLKIYDVNENRKVHIMNQVASGITYLHSMKPDPVVHRDVKPPNTLITLLNGLHVVKLCDVGLSQSTSRYL